MAITKTLFRNDSLALQAPEILTWLQTNATEYFDNITYDSDNSKIVCEIGLLTAIEIFFTGTTAFTAYLSNGNSISCVRSDQSHPAIFVAGIATKNGLCISYENKALSTPRTNYLIITKDNNGDVTFISHGQSAAATTQYNRLRTGTFTKFNWNDWYGSATAAQMYESGGFMGSQAGLTSLIPFTDSTYPIYTPNCYKLNFNQYFGAEGQFTIDGASYYTTGYIALSDA